MNTTICLCADMLMHLIEHHLGEMHVDDSFRKTTLILRYILQCWFIDNIMVVACTGW